MNLYERKINEEGDEIVDKPLIEISANSEIVRLQNPDSYHIKTVPVDEFNKLKKHFTLRSRFGIYPSAYLCSAKLSPFWNRSLHCQAIRSCLLHFAAEKWP